MSDPVEGKGKGIPGRGTGEAQKRECLAAVGL